jgi:hypothetical protein
MSKIRVFASSVKFNYSRGLKYVNVKDPNSTFYTSLYGNSLQLNNGESKRYKSITI